MVMEMNVLFFFGVYGLGPLQSSSEFNFETMTTSTEDLLLITKPVPIDTSGKYTHSSSRIRTNDFSDRAVQDLTITCKVKSKAVPL
jgi:hypothetical protein